MDLSTPIVMGVLNLTPDSFYAGSRIDKSGVLQKASAMLEEGAAILDVGGYSTRPNAPEVSAEEEKSRLCDAISLLRKHLPEACISADTFRPEVAAEALDAGADLINDVSGGSQEMFELIAKRKVPYVLMHSKGNPQTMQSLAVYENVVEEVFDFLNHKLYQIKELGVVDVLIDPGFGFAKTIEQNYLLLSELERFLLIDAPLMIGISRKSFIYKTLQISPDEALNGSTVLHTVALMKGAQVLRVHDVAPAKQAIDLLKKIPKNIS